MNEKMSDKGVKEKIQSLETLSGGIVFGNEEAWERLQARMEQKPVRKIPVKFWMAAAAILLLMVSVATIYYYPSKEVAKNNNEKSNNPTDNIAITRQTAPVAQQPEIQVQKIVTPGGYSSRHIVSSALKNKKTEQAEITKVLIAQTPLNEIKTDKDKPVAVIPVPVPAVQKQMKTVHINELERKDVTQQTAATYMANAPVIDLSKLPTVHVKELEKVELEERATLIENRRTLAGELLFKPAYKPIYNDDEVPEEYHQYRNPLKNIFNLQN